VQDAPQGLYDWALVRYTGWDYARIQDQPAPWLRLMQRWALTEYELDRLVRLKEFRAR